jgi:hypothetical protein
LCIAWDRMSSCTLARSEACHAVCAPALLPVASATFAPTPAFWIHWAVCSQSESQPLRGLQTNPRRYLWNHLHHWTGRLAIVLAIVNVYLGLHLSNVSVPCSMPGCHVDLQAAGPLSRRDVRRPVLLRLSRPSMLLPSNRKPLPLQALCSSASGKR